MATATFDQVMETVRQEMLPDGYAALAEKLPELGKAASTGTLATYSTPAPWMKYKVPAGVLANHEVEITFDQESDAEHDLGNGIKGKVMESSASGDVACMITGPDDKRYVQIIQNSGKSNEKTIVLCASRLNDQIPRAVAVDKDLTNITSDESLLFDADGKPCLLGKAQFNMKYTFDGDPVKFTEASGFADMRGYSAFGALDDEKILIRKDADGKCYVQHLDASKADHLDMLLAARAEDITFHSTPDNIDASVALGRQRMVTGTFQSKLPADISNGFKTLMHGDAGTSIGQRVQAMLSRGELQEYIPDDAFNASLGITVVKGNKYQLDFGGPVIEDPADPRNGKTSAQKRPIRDVEMVRHFKDPNSGLCVCCLAGKDAYGRFEHWVANEPGKARFWQAQKYEENTLTMIEHVLEPEAGNAQKSFVAYDKNDKSVSMAVNDVDIDMATSVSPAKVVGLLTLGTLSNALLNSSAGRQHAGGMQAVDSVFWKKSRAADQYGDLNGTTDFNGLRDKTYSVADALVNNYWLAAPVVAGVAGFMGAGVIATMGTVLAAGMAVKFARLYNDTNVQNSSSQTLGFTQAVQANFGKEMKMMFGDKAPSAMGATGTVLAAGAGLIGAGTMAVGFAPAVAITVLAMGLGFGPAAVRSTVQAAKDTKELFSSGMQGVTTFATNVTNTTTGGKGALAQMRNMLAQQRLSAVVRGATP